MKSRNEYVAPAVELFKLSPKEDCMLLASDEATEGNIIVDYDDIKGN